MENFWFGVLLGLSAWISMYAACYGVWRRWRREIERWPVAMRLMRLAEYDYHWRRFYGIGDDFAGSDEHNRGKEGG